MATQRIAVPAPAVQFQQQTSPSNPSLLYGGAIKLDFDAKGHTYAVTDLATLSIREVPSVTTILEVIGTCKWPLKQWAANMTADYIRAAIRPGLRYDELQIEQIIESARKNFHTVSRGAKTIGTLAHEWIEAHLRARLYGTPELPMPVNEQARNSIQAAANWIAEHFKPLSMEHRLYSREHDYAGTLDVVGDVDGQIAVVDWKTSKAIYDEMPLQAAAYAQAWAEMYDERVPDRWVIRLDKETGEFEPVRFPRETFRRDLRGFLAAKALHLTIEAMKKPRSSRRAAPAAVPAKSALAVAPKPGPMAPVRAQIPPADPQPAPTPKGSASRPIPSAPAQPQNDTAKPQDRKIMFQRQNGSLILTGATFAIKDALKQTLRATPRRSGDRWEWEAPAACFDALSGACQRAGIRLLPTA